MIPDRNMRHLQLFFKTTAILVTVVLSGCLQESSQTVEQTGKSQPSAISPTAASEADGSLLAEGAVLFAKLCTSCHGTAGSGRGSRSGPSLQRTEFTYGNSASTIMQSIREGRPGGMPSFGHVFTPRQLEALSTYILSLKK